MASLKRRSRIIRASSSESVDERCLSSIPISMNKLMTGYGLTREQAAGIVGNIGEESAGFSTYHETGQPEGKVGVGWAQWTNSGGDPRRDKFEAWVKAHATNISPRVIHNSRGPLPQLKKKRPSKVQCKPSRLLSNGPPQTQRHIPSG
jgi:hypothetical protein